MFKFLCLMSWYYRLFCFVLNILIIIIDNFQHIFRFNRVDKFISSSELEDIQVKTDDGYKPVTHGYVTKPFVEYIIVTENYKLKAADKHIVFRYTVNGNKPVRCDELLIGDVVIAESGPEKVLDIRKSFHKKCMYDITVDSENHRYYTNGILSHNTITTSIYILHFIIFNQNKNVMIVANKHETTKEIVKKIKDIYELLPFFIKPGLSRYNVKSIKFGDTKCEIKTEARSEAPAIGYTIDLLYIDEFAHIPSNIINKFYTAAYPTVASMDNSKIILTSTPNGYNLFHKLITLSELPEDDPNKYPYKVKRVYWYDVDGRIVTYIRLKGAIMRKMGIKLADVENKLEKLGWWITDDKKAQPPEGKYRATKVFNSKTQSIDFHIQEKEIDKTTEEIKKLSIERLKNIETGEYEIYNDEVPDGYELEEVKLLDFSNVSSWKIDNIKGIGGEKEFKQEFEIQFLVEGNGLLDEELSKNLESDCHVFETRQFDLLDKKLAWDYNGRFVWINDEEIFPKNINYKDYHFVIGVDLAEGLEKDYTVFNIMLVKPCTGKELEKRSENAKKIEDYFDLIQVGYFRSNAHEIEECAELFYLLVFEIMEPEKVKVTLEYNTFGAHFEKCCRSYNAGENEFGNYVFVRYSHAPVSRPHERKVGYKMGSQKNIWIKKLKTLMSNGQMKIKSLNCFDEVRAFTKKDLSRLTYYSETGHDDQVMTLVGISSIFDQIDWNGVVNSYIYGREKDEEIVKIEEVMFKRKDNVVNGSDILLGSRNESQFFNQFPSKMR